MVRLIAGIILVFFSLQVNGQQRNSRTQNSPPSFEEFRAKIHSTENPDSLLSNYVLFAREIVNTHPDSTLALSEEVMTLDQIDVFKRRAYKNLILTSYWFRPSPDSALKHSDKALNLFEELDDKPRVLEVLITQGRLQSLANNYVLSEEKYLDALEYLRADELSSFDREIILNELTDLYIKVGATDLALDRYNQLLEIEPLTPFKECSILLKISNAHKRNQEIELAKEKLLKCENNEDLDSGFKSAILRSLSDLDRILGNTEDRIRRLEKVVEVEAQNNRRSFTSNLFLARAYLDNSEPVKTDSLITVLETFNIQRTALPATIDFYLLKTEFLIQSELLEEALISSEEAIALAKRLPPTPLLIDAYKLQAEIYKKTGDFEAAYNSVNKINEMGSSVQDRGRISEEAMGKVRLQMRAKNDELAEVTSQLGTVKTRNALIILALVVIAFYAIYRYKVYYLLREERTRNRIARDLHDDLSGTLSSISFFSEAAKREQQDLSKYGKFLQKIDESAVEAKEKINDIIWAINPENDDWNAFLTKCRRYAAEMFESKDISYDIDIDPNIALPTQIKTRNDLWLIFKEIITNLVRHSKATEAKVKINVKKNELILEIEDNGVGFEIDDNHEGNGIFNIKKRIHSISKSNDLRLNSSPGKGTKWDIKFIF